MLSDSKPQPNNNIRNSNSNHNLKTAPSSAKNYHSHKTAAFAAKSNMSSFSEGTPSSSDDDYDMSAGSFGKELDDEDNDFGVKEFSDNSDMDDENDYEQQDNGGNVEQQAHEKVNDEPEIDPVEAAEELKKQANELYKKALYSESIALYSQAIGKCSFFIIILLCYFYSDCLSSSYSQNHFPN